MRHFFVYVLLFSSISFSSVLPGSLKNSEIEKLTGTITWGAQHKAWTAPLNFLDSNTLSLGLETSFFFDNNVNDYGDKKGQLEGVLPMPRVWGSYHFAKDFSLSASLSPGFLYEGLTSVGAAFEWMAFRWNEFDTNVSIFAKYSYVDAYGELTASAPELGLQVSRDYEYFYLYSGAGFVSATGSIKKSLKSASANKASYTRFGLHLYAGMNFDLFDVPFTTQVDLYNGEANLGLLVTHHF